jgi:uncharacterized protein YuzE
MKINNPINIRYDPEADVLYFTLKRGKVFETRKKGLNLIDYNRKGEILGVKILNCSGKDFSMRKKRVRFP